ncbi:MAG TPA: hypothetical protein VFU68_09170 [Terracidiphilus sp.]|nr:hypothetical protein [Terracidiphilus sp.]
MPVMTEVKRPVWSAREDRVIHAVWLGVFWVGIVGGFGLDMKPFLAARVPALVYAHAAVYVGWLLLLTAQVLLVMKDKVALHRKLGKLGVVWAVLVVLLGPPTALTVIAHNPMMMSPQFFSVNLVDVGGFAVMFAWAIAMRRNPAVHKRLILAAMAAFADPGFSRITGNLMPEPKALWPWFWYMFYGNVGLVVLVLAWDLWRYRRTVWQFAVGAGVVLASDVWASVMYFDPSWKVTTTHWVEAWVRLTR